MNEELDFRLAATADTARILEIIGQAKAQMRALGSRQWQEGYPAATDIATDIACGRGWVLARATIGTTFHTALATSPPDTPPIEAQQVIAYGAVVYDGEPAYNNLDGQWLTNGAYVVVHRLAVADGEKGQGVATEFIRRVEAQGHAGNIVSFRIDTNFDNHYMLHLLATCGFTFCGRVHYASGERLAFEKKIEGN